MAPGLTESQRMCAEKCDLGLEEGCSNLPRQVASRPNRPACLTNVTSSSRLGGAERRDVAQRLDNPSAQSSEYCYKQILYLLSGYESGGF